MIRNDLPRVMEIEFLSFELPLSTQEIVDHLHNRSVIGIVARRGDEIVGYMLYRLDKESLEVMRMAIHPEFRKSGVGRAMIERLRNKLSTQRRKYLVASVGERDLQSQLFFRACGFRVTEIWQFDEGDVYRFTFEKGA